MPRLVGKCMDEETRRTRKRLKDIGSIEEFNDLLERTMLSIEEKQILILYYKEQKTLTYIADFLGMSEITVKRKPKKLLMKIGKLL
mgnify:FL=1